MPVGIMWGNDPKLTGAKAAAGEKPKQSWIKPEAEIIRKQLNGTRPSWGWNGRMNGPGKSSGPIASPLEQRRHSRVQVTDPIAYCSRQLYFGLLVLPLNLGAQAVR